MKLLYHSWRLSRRFRDYQPRRISSAVVLKYLKQFQRKDRPAAVKLLYAIRYLSERETSSLLSSQLDGIRQRCIHAGIPEENVILCPASSIGESSEAMLSMAEKVISTKRLRFRVFRGDALSLRRQVRDEAAIVVFVDDFAGTGDQFAEAFQAWQVGVASPRVTPLLLSVVMCSEAKAKIRPLGVEVVYAIEDTRGNRFQALCGNVIDSEQYATLSSYAVEIHSKWPAGYLNMGSMFVFFRNATNNMSFLLRGTCGQRVWHGLFPRQDQLSPNPRPIPICNRPT